MAYDFWKYHALGNDYLVIDPNLTAFDPAPEAVRLVCDRHFGVGSDGILLGPLMEEGGMRLRIFNPDGSEAEKSGNGIRIFSRYLVEAGYVKERSFILRTLGGEVLVEVLNESASMIKVDMGTVTFQSDEIPVTGPSREVVDEPLAVGDRVFRITCASVGNPHCVIPLPGISAELAKEYGPRIENHPYFPRRINVQFLRVLDRKNIQIEIWERGAGYTLASGSSSSAAACAAYRLGLVEPSLTVHMPGGEIGIEIEPGGHVHMTGPVAAVARGEFAGEIRGRMKG